MTVPKRCGAVWIAVALALAALLGVGGTMNFAVAQTGVNRASAPPYTVRWKQAGRDDRKAFVEVSGLSAGALEKLAGVHWQLSQWQQLLGVYASQENASTAGLAMLGHYSIERGALRFEPKFPLEPGMSYAANFHPENLPGENRAAATLITAAFRLPTPVSNPTTIVTQVFPSADVVPENLLKFYLHFSAPMRRGHIYDYIHLLNENGKPVELPFLEIDEELWNPAMTRLTLFIDPGRIKRGVRPLEEIGPALEAGKRYALVIDDAWTDATGNPLRETFRKEFRAGPVDRDPPDPAQWKITPPVAGSSDPVVIAFPKPMDRALAERLIRVTARDTNAVIEGTVSISEEERCWSFKPAHPWRRGACAIVVQTTIEDLAGNNIGKPFEVDVVETTQTRLSKEFVSLPFEVR